MKTIFYLFFAVQFIFVACKPGNEQSAAKESGNDENATEQSSAVDRSKRYAIKSGVVIYKGPMGVVQTLTFDNYGAIERFTSELEMGTIKTTEIQIRRDGFQYAFKEDQTTGMKTKWQTNDISYDKMDKELMERYKIKEIGKENIAGKECRKYSAEFGSAPVVTWIWNNIMMKTVTKMGNSEMIIEAVKIEEGPVDAALFEIPSNVTFKEF